MPHPLLIEQRSLEGFCLVSDAVDKLAGDSGANERGAIYTKREIVEFMLDLAGYEPNQPLHRMRLLEPSFGGGEFLLAAINRLMSAFKAAGVQSDLADCICAVELHRSTFNATKEKINALLLEHGLNDSERARLISAWLIAGDFLLHPIQGRFDFVVGNPPYVRQEMIPTALLGQYRKLYATLYDRADLYVPFIERSLTLLADGGQLAFICADRWTKNKYGGPLRAMVSGSFHLRAYVNMADTPAFNSDVVAYPAITLIEHAQGRSTMVAQHPDIDVEKLALLAKSLRAGKPSAEHGVSLVEHACSGSEPWVLGASDKRALLRRLEAQFPTLEEAGCKVGIGAPPVLTKPSSPQWMNST